MSPNPAQETNTDPQGITRDRNHATGFPTEASSQDDAQFYKQSPSRDDVVINHAHIFSTVAQNSQSPPNTLARPQGPDEVRNLETNSAINSDINGLSGPSINDGTADTPAPLSPRRTNKRSADKAFHSNDNLSAVAENGDSSHDSKRRWTASHLSPEQDHKIPHLLEQLTEIGGWATDVDLVEVVDELAAEDLGQGFDDNENYIESGRVRLIRDEATKRLQNIRE